MDQELNTGEGSDQGVPRELRRGYHDRISELRERTFAMLAMTVRQTEAVTAALIDPSRSADRLVTEGAVHAQALASEVDEEVVDMLARQSPMARDLRVILASRDVCQMALLCVGLCLSLTTRDGSSQAVIASGMEVLVAEVGAHTAAMLRQAETAWTGMDADLAEGVFDAARGVRAEQIQFSSALLGLREVPIDQALALGLVARAYERLVDHAVEIAERVQFAALGIPARVIEV